MDRSEIRGWNELIRTMKQLEKLPQKCVTKSAKDGMKIVLKAARVLAPVDDGTLRIGIKLVGERARIPGKKVYQVVPDSALNHVFRKPVPDPNAEHPRGKGVYGGKNDTAYYPASQEYGFLTAGGYVPGYHFMRNAMDNNYRAVEQKMISVMTKEIDKIR